MFGRLRSLFTRQNGFPSMAGSPQAQAYMGDAGILCSHTPAAFRLINKEGIRAVIWTPDDERRSRTARKLEQLLSELSPADQAAIGNALTDRNQKILSLKGDAKSAFKIAAKYSDDTIALMKHMHNRVDDGYFHTMDILRFDRNDSLSPAENICHADYGLRSRMIHVAFGPTTVLYNSTQNEISVPPDSFLLFKGGSHTDKKAALLHRAPLYSERQPRFYLSTLSR